MGTTPVGRRSSTTRGQGRTLAIVLGLAGGLLGAAPGREGVRLDPRYLALLRLYARGDRPQAVSGLAEWSEGSLRSQLAAVERAAAAGERCPKCPDPLADIPLRAAVMLHSARDQVERPNGGGREQLPLCPGMHARIAQGYAAVLARREGTRDFARRFFLARALRSQLDACFDDAHARTLAGLELFPRDAELLFARGSEREERATLPMDGDSRRSAPVQQDWLKEARRDFEDAVAADPDLHLARVRLGRVLWRLGRPDESLEVLAEAVTRPARDPRDLYLAHLFLGRVHDDAGRTGEAVAAYRQALAIDPGAQSAAVGLAHALQLQGEMEEARRVLASGLVPRSSRDPYWDYLVSNARAMNDLADALHRESLE